MSRHVKYIDNLFKIARDMEPVSGAKIAAAIVLHNKVVAYGFNSRKTSPFQKRWGKNSDAICIHAELDAIKNSLKRLSLEELASSTLYISRSKKNGHKGTDVHGLALPCEGCSRAILNFDIKKVCYSTDVDGEFEWL